MSTAFNLAKRGYGTRTTIYKPLSNKELFGMYRGSVWNGLKENNRQQLLQETVNRVANTMGEKGACEVRFADLPTGVYGQHFGSVIELNRQHFVHDLRGEIVYGGRKIKQKLLCSNYLALETVLHENIHAWQNQCINGTISYSNKALIDEYRANSFTRSIVASKKGVKQWDSHYLNGETPYYGYYLYYLQSTERDAHKYSESSAMRIMEQNLKQFGSDATADDYKKEVEVNGYEATLSKAKNRFGKENIEQDINNVLKNQYYGASNKVDPTVERIVKNEMTKSYDYQHGDAHNNSVAGRDSNDSIIVRGSGLEGVSIAQNSMSSEAIIIGISSLLENNKSDTGENLERAGQDNDLVNENKKMGAYEMPAEENAEQEEQASDLSEGADEPPAEENAEQEEQANDLAEGADEPPAEENAEQEEQASDLTKELSIDESASEDESSIEKQSYSY